MNRDEMLKYAQPGSKEKLLREFKASDALIAALDDKDKRAEIAKDITAFANRFGGAIFYGITDDGYIERCTKLAGLFDRLKQMIAQIAQDNIAPPVLVDCDLDSDPIDGDVVIVKIPGRGSIPHARVRDKKDRIVREYYIRTPHGNAPVPDSLLGQLFRSVEDVDIEEQFNIILHYAKHGLWSVPPKWGHEISYLQPGAVVGASRGWIFLGMGEPFKRFVERGLGGWGPCFGAAPVVF